MKGTFQLTRFVCPRDGQVRLTSGGFLEDPSGSVNLNPDVRSLDSVMGTPCLVLLGEPGIGKTHALNHAYDRLALAYEDSSDRALSFNLGVANSDTMLSQLLFQHPEFLHWNIGTHDLHLILDSLDEALASIGNIAPLILRQLEEIPTDRLKLVIACRTFDWPASLEEGLKEIWSDPGDMHVFELLPLRRPDVAEVADAQGLDSAKFLDAVDQSRVGPFAGNPLTLDLLLDVFEQGHAFPESSAEIYELSCRRLCEDSRTTHREHTAEIETDPDIRFAVASRAAACTIFGGYKSIWTGVFSGSAPEGAISISELTGGAEATKGREFDVYEGHVYGALRSALFNSRGPQLMGWAHQSYAEFLAARFLSSHELELPQVRSLLSQVEALGPDVPPELRGCAAWLAVMDRRVFDWLLDVSPATLVRADASGYDDSQREDLLDHLLSRPDLAAHLHRDWQIRERLSSLRHERLAEQLSRYIEDKEQPQESRSLAAEVAIAAGLSQLEDIFVTISLERSEPHELRKTAAIALARHGGPDSKMVLKPLLTLADEEDPDDGLKGAALHALWPDHMTVEAAIEALQPPKRPNLFGLYASFIGSAFAAGLGTIDLAFAISKLDELGTRLGLFASGLAESVYEQASYHMDEPEILEAVAQQVIARVHRIEPPLPRSRGKGLEVDDRRRLAEIIVSRATETSTGYWLLAGQDGLVVPEDTVWLIENIQAENDLVPRQIWADLAVSLMDQTNPEHVTLLYDATADSQELERFRQRIFGPCLLNSQHSEIMKEAHERERARTRDQRERAARDWSTIEAKCTELLQVAESGEHGAWWQMNFYLLGEPGHYVNEYRSDIREGAFWQRSEPDLCMRILRSGQSYIESVDIRGELNGKEVAQFRPAAAGFRAFRLLTDEEPEVIASLPEEVWKKWIIPIIGFRSETSDGGYEAQKSLIASALSSAPTDFYSGLRSILLKENHASSSLHSLRLIDHVNDKDLNDSLGVLLENPELAQDSMLELLKYLLERQHQGAYNYAVGLLSTLSISDPTEKSLLMSLCRLLLRHSPSSAWSLVWNLVLEEPEFGEELFLTMGDAFSHDAAILGSKLDEDAVGELIVWLNERFPPEKDPEHPDFHPISQRENVARLRDSLLFRLVGRGTPSAAEAVATIVNRFPDRPLGWLLEEAKDALSKATWSPHSPDEILRLVASKDHRLIDDGDQLLEVLVESIDRMQAEIQGETPSVRLLWDKQADNSYRPVDESTFSDYVKLFMEKDLIYRGIVLNREVEIRRFHAGSGERTDIHVDAISQSPQPGGGNLIRAIIEVKGEWHGEVDNAMRSQLADRYLEDHQSPYGLYLVGWFCSDKWDGEDNRRKSACKKELDDQRSFLSEQAQQLSAEKGFSILSRVVDARLL